MVLRRLLSGFGDAGPKRKNAHLTDNFSQAEPKRCILTGVELTKDNDSKAHVIPSALGGRLKPTGILSRDANTILGNGVDRLLVEALSPIMSQLNGSRDRGDNQPVVMEDANGARYEVAFNKPLRMTRPVYEEIELEAATQFRIQARTPREARTLLGRIKAKHPTFDIDEAMKQARFEPGWPEGGSLKLELELGSRRTFPGTYAAASVFAAFKGLSPHPAFRSYVNSFSSENPIQPPDTFYFYLEHDWIDASAEVTHNVVLVADPNRHQTLVAIDLFNVLSIAVVLPYEGNASHREAYAVDV